MVQVIIPEQEPEPDIRPFRRNQLSDQHNEEPQSSPQHDASQRQEHPHDAAASYTTREQTIDEQAVSDSPIADKKERTSHHARETNFTATRAQPTGHPYVPFIQRNDYAHHTSHNEPIDTENHSRVDQDGSGSVDMEKGSAPLKSILGVAARFRKRSGPGNNIEMGQGSWSEIDLVSEKGTGETIVVPVRSTSSSGYTRSTQPLHAHFLDAQPKAAPTLYVPNANNIHVHATPVPVLTEEEQGATLRDIGPMRPPTHIKEIFTPDRKLGVDPTWSESLKNTVKSSYINYLIPIIPVAWALHFSHQSDVIVFVFTFIAVIPLASLLSFATEQLALRMGDALGGLLNATFGNAVELLISILALVKGEIGLVQASMIGSILSNTLLVLGCCFFAGGLRFHEQIYAVSASQLQISLLGISMCALVLPAAYQFSVNSLSSSRNNRIGEITDLSSQQERSLLSISRGISFMLLSTYGVYLVFQLYTHAYLFKRRPMAIKRPHLEPGAPHPTHEKVLPISSWLDSIRSRGSSSSSSSTSDAGGLTPTTTRDTIVPLEHNVGESSSLDPELGLPAGRAETPTSARSKSEKDEEEDEVPKIKALWAFGLLLGVTALTGVTAEFLLDSINGLTETTSVSSEFVGLILLPLVGNSVEHVCAVTVSVKDKLDLSLSIAIGSSIQVALGLLPLLVLIGWAIGQPMSLFFDTFETITLAISLILVNFAIGQGRTNWAQGYILIMSYALIALTTWYYDPSGVV